MGFTDAVTTVLSKYAVFTGRATRPEYWWFFLFNVILSIILTFVDRAILGFPLLGTIVSLALLLPGIGVGVRRLHDIDKSGWWLFIALIPLVGVIILIVWLVQSGTPGPNRFGPQAA